MKRTILDVRIYEVDAPEDMSDEDLIEAFNVGDIEGYEVDGRIELEGDE
jgi:hypothetical protein